MQIFSDFITKNLMAFKIKNLEGVWSYSDELTAHFVLNYFHKPPVLGLTVSSKTIGSVLF